jgi:Big-like domain-containing protein
MGVDLIAAVASVSKALRGVLLAGLAICTLASCCPGNGCSDDPNAWPISMSIYLPPELVATHTTDQDSVPLEGTVDRGGVSVLLTIDGGMPTPVTVQGGGLEPCRIDGNPYLCGVGYSWSATVPLHLGTNAITATAHDGRGNRGQVTISVTRISGLPDVTQPVTPPTLSLISTTPRDEASGVAVNAPIVAIFSKRMDGRTITTETFQLTDSNGNPVPGTVTTEGVRATFQPASPLAGYSTYAAIVAASVKDQDGIELNSPVVWHFTTTFAPDVTPPRVIATSPLSGSSCVDIDTTVTATFDEEIKPSTVNSSTFILKDAAENPVASVISSPAANSLRLVPSTSLLPSTTYSATLAAGIQDLAGNATPTTVKWSFTTLADGTGAWQSISQVGAAGETAVWTGTEMIVWGGLVNNSWVGGRRYRPASDTWVAMASAGAPSRRFGHAAVWTGSEMIVWGGEGADFVGLLDGGIYNPATDTWRSMSSVGAVNWYSFTAVWTGTEMITLDRFLGARYNLARDSWTPIPPFPIPMPAELHSIWTGTRMLVLAGNPVGCDNYLNACSIGGAAYDPETNAWSPISTTGAPSLRVGYATAWTGKEMAVWGGRSPVSYEALATGALYDPQSDTWRLISAACGLSGRSGHSAVWDGTEIIIWGGWSGGGQVPIRSLTTGARYDPIADSWKLITVSGAPLVSLDGHRALWSGTEMLVWYNGNGAKYRP